MKTVQKHYTLVRTPQDVEKLVDHINSHDLITFDTESTGLNTRKDSVIGFSVCGEIGDSFYVPFVRWNTETEVLEDLMIENHTAREVGKKILKKLQGKKLVMHNGDFDTRIVKHNLGIDLLPSLYCDTILLIHTVQEEGVGRGGAEVCGLKKVAIAIQDKIGLDVERAANEEQIELKASIEKNGGSITREKYELYKADLDVIGKYAAADTDLTLRIYNYYLPELKEECLEKFFFEEEVMPVYKEVTMPMEDHGVMVDIPLLEKTMIDILYYM